ADGATPAAAAAAAAAPQPASPAAPREPAAAAAVRSRFERFELRARAVVKTEPAPGIIGGGLILFPRSDLAGKAPRPAGDAPPPSPRPNRARAGFPRRPVATYTLRRKLQHDA